MCESGGPSHPPIICLMCSNFCTLARLFFFKFSRVIPVPRYSVDWCGHCVGMLLVVGVEGG